MVDYMLPDNVDELRQNDEIRILEERLGGMSKGDQKAYLIGYLDHFRYSTGRPGIFDESWVEKEDSELEFALPDAFRKEPILADYLLQTLESVGMEDKARVLRRGMKIGSDVESCIKRNDGVIHGDQT